MFENLQGFFASTTGQMITVGMIVVFFALILIPGKGQKSKKPDAKALTVSALMVALAMGLNQLTLFRMPQGGNITLLSMLPIAICAYLLGTRRGIMAGICLGLLDLIFHSVCNPSCTVSRGLPFRLWRPGYRRYLAGS